MEYYLVGKIINTHGIRGEVKVINESNLNRFIEGAKLYVKREDKYIPIIINTVRYHQKYLLITFNHIDNINNVLSYVGLNLYVRGHDDNSREKGKYYYDELIGCKVYNQHNVYIGLVNDIIELPKGVLLEVKQENNHISLVPYVDEFVKTIDITNKKITIQEIEGLL